MADLSHTEITQKINFWQRFTGFNVMLFFMPLLFNYKQLPTISGPLFISIFALPCIIFGVVRMILLKRAKK